MNTHADGAIPPIAPSRRDGVLSLLFGVAIALLFFYVLRGTGSRAPLALINNGNDEAGAAALAAHAFIAGGIALFLRKLSERLGFFGLLALVLTLLGVIIAWGLPARLADGLPFVGAPTALLVLALFAFKSWQRGALRAPLTRGTRALALAVSAPVLLLAFWIVALRPLFF